MEGTRMQWKIRIGSSGAFGAAGWKSDLRRGGELLGNDDADRLEGQRAILLETAVGRTAVHAGQKPGGIDAVLVDDRGKNVDQRFGCDNRTWTPLEDAAERFHGNVQLRCDLFHRAAGCAKQQLLQPLGNCQYDSVVQQGRHITPLRPQAGS